MRELPFPSGGSPPPLATGLAILPAMPVNDGVARPIAPGGQGTSTLVVVRFSRPQAISLRQLSDSCRSGDYSTPHSAASC